jgi:hypothetical protein
MLKPSLAPQPRPPGRLAITTGSPDVAIATNNRDIAITPDGTRFLMIDDSGGGPDAANAAGVFVVLNWAEEIKASLPAAKR